MEAMASLRYVECALEFPGYLRRSEEGRAEEVLQEVQECSDQVDIPDCRPLLADFRCGGNYHDPGATSFLTNPRLLETKGQ